MSWQSTGKACPEVAQDDAVCVPFKNHRPGSPGSVEFEVQAGRRSELTKAWMDRATGCAHLEVTEGMGNELTKAWKDGATLGRCRRCSEGSYAEVPLTATCAL